MQTLHQWAQIFDHPGKKSELSVSHSTIITAGQMTHFVINRREVGAEKAEKKQEVSMTNKCIW